MKTINIGIIGCGAVAENCHFPALKRVPRLNILALSEVNKARLKEVKKKICLHETFFTNNYHEVLNNPEIDAVLILTPPNLHARITVDAIKAGKHVFCEKPFIFTTKEASEVLHALHHNKVKLMVGYNFRFLPHFAKMKKFVEKGTIGKIIVVTTNFFSSIKNYPSVTGFQFKNEMGGGALFEMGCHHIDLIRWIVGEVKAVKASIWKFDPSITADDNALVCLDFANGVIGSVNISWSAPSLHRVEIFGEEGIIRADLSKPYLELYLQGKSIFKHGAIEIPAKSVMSSYSLELNHFADCILKEKEPLVGAEDGIQVLKIVSKCYESARTGQKIGINKVNNCSKK